MDILGRSLGESSSRAGIRSSAVSGPKVEVGYCSGAQGTATVEAFFSTNDEDRGGIVLRIAAKGTDCSFIPAAKDIEGGVELHLAGQAEAESFIRALRGVLAAFPTR